MNDKQAREKIRKALTRKINENLFAGYGFGNDKRNIIGPIMRKEGSIETPDTPDLDIPEAPVSDTAAPPISGDKINSPELPKEEKPKKPEKPKAKSKDWEELIEEISLYLDQASLMIGDERGDQKIKILDKLYDTLKEKFISTHESFEEPINEKKKNKK
jgi:hypothetical protein